MKPLFLKLALMGLAPRALISCALGNDQRYVVVLLARAELPNLFRNRGKY